MQTDNWLQARFSEIRPRAMAALTGQFRDVEIAEEAFSISCLRALKTWPEKGLPNDPFAWLLFVGRNAGRDILRKQSREGPADPSFALELPEENLRESEDHHGLRDDVLRLLFICCHPSLSPQDQSAVALRIVTGMTVDEIARAFLVKPKTLEQRITRAKRTIAQAGTPFETPDLIERNNRLNTVMLMIYLLFNEGWSASSGDVHIKTTLCEEAIRLTRLLLDLFPGVSELMGLLALFLLQHSRLLSRLDTGGTMIALDQQNRQQWDQQMIAEAKNLLEKALRHAAPGPYQIQAAIAAVHASAVTSAATDWAEIERLYSLLHVIDPTPVVKLNHASAIAKLKGPRAALDMLKPIASELENYRWYHGALGAFHFELDEFELAKKAYEKVLLLGPTKQEQAFIEQKITICEKIIN